MSIVPNFDWTVFQTLPANSPLKRGERNNNPGNLVNTPETWQGEIVDGDDPRFMQFTTAVLGIRALAKLLLNYEKKYGLCTIEGLIGRWAPPNENDTEQYIKDVCKECKVGRTEKVEVRSIILPLVTSVIRKECGRVAYKSQVIQAGITLAVVGHLDGSPTDDAPDMFADCVPYVELSKLAAGLAITLHIVPDKKKLSFAPAGLAIIPAVVMH